MSFFYAFGFLLWLGATIIFRLWGHYFLVPDQPLLVTVVFIAAIPLIAGVTYPLYKWRGVTRADTAKAALGLALPGMLLDIVSLLNFEAFFPNLETRVSSYFAAWLLWAYSLILLTGALMKARPAHRH